MTKEKFLTHVDVELNIKKLKSFMKRAGLDSFYVSSGDIFLNEYVPLADCHRYYVTNFTGSTAEVIVPLNGKVILFVDGRYFEQADLEVDLKQVEVYKCKYNTSIKEAMKSVIAERGLSHIGIEGDRTDLSLFKDLSLAVKVTPFNNGELHTVIDFRPLSFEKKIIEVPLEYAGESTLLKCQKILRPNEAFYITALDSIAWLTNLRRYEMPNQCTFRAKALCTHQKVYLLLEEMEGNIENPEIEISIGKFSQVEGFLKQIKDYEETWLPETEGHAHKIEKVFYSDRSINLSDYQKLASHFGEENLRNVPEGIVPYHAIKNSAELSAMAASFDLGDQAIFNTIAWVKDQVQQGQNISEMDFYNKTNEIYASFGALEQSFKTISAIGPNSSIVHFSSPSDDMILKSEELVLLDSGGYFVHGYATDTTRSFLSGGTAKQKQKEIYTVVLKALLAAQNAVFPEGTWGSLIDGIARQPVFKYGLNYNHGTGHGIGINVHEGGYRISSTSNVPLRENSVGSLEPGIYIPGFGGVRLENVVVVEKDPKRNGMLYFRPLVYIGFDHELIDESLLSEEEKIWLEDYERECQKRGRSFKYPSDR